MKNVVVKDDIYSFGYDVRPGITCTSSTEKH